VENVSLECCTIPSLRRYAVAWFTAALQCTAGYELLVNVDFGGVACRSWGCTRNPKSFDLSKIWAISQKI